MSENSALNKLNQFNDFFLIESQFNVNVIRSNAENIPTFDEFVSEIPLPFKMANDIAKLDHAAFKPLQTLTSVAGQLVEYLTHQTRKIDLVVNYILSQEDDECYRHQGTAFGGGGIIFSARSAFDLAEILQVKIFLLEENCAIYSYVQVAEIMQQGDDFLHKVIFHHIREDDRELLVRASLHQQSKQLQRSAQERQKTKR